ncbi:MAG TPA: ParA family protein, partial [Micromonosporaceae bacterium]
MALIALTSAKGSPGVSTAALAFALTWRARVVLAECDPAGGDLRAGPLAGLALPIERGLVGLAMAEARGRLAEEFWGQLVDLDPPGRRRLALPGLQRSGQALTLRGAWPPIAACFSALEPAGYHLVADCGRLATSYPPWPVFQRSDLILLALRPSPGGVAAAWSALGDLRRHLIEADLAIDSIGLLTIGASEDCRGELERVLQCRVLVELPDDARSTATLTGRSAGQRL